jgi:magnesium transporter
MARKKRYHDRKRHKPGTPPGTLTHVHNAPAPIIHLIAYGAENVAEAALSSAAEIRDYVGKWPVLWVNVDGLGDAATIQAIGEIFGLHQLALEDTLNTHQRPKTEEYGNNLYTVCRMVNESSGGELDLEQISLFLGNGFVISFQEAPGDCWKPVRERIHYNVSKRFRSHGADYLMYSLLDALIDDYFPLLERLGDALDDLEGNLLENPEKNFMVAIQKSKRDLYTIRHVIWPMRESIGQIIANEDLIDPGTKIFLRDCQDHITQLLDITESYRERSSGLMEIYLSSLSNRMNEVMRVLTVISTIFMPLTFIVGVYGMNFKTEISPFNMPELSLRYGYPTVMLFMLFIVVGMVIYFGRKGWLSESAPAKKADKDTPDL